MTREELTIFSPAADDMPGVCGKFIVPNRIESFRIDLIHRDAFVGVRDLVGRCVHWDISNKTVISVGVSNTNTLKGGEIGQALLDFLFIPVDLLVILVQNPGCTQLC